MPLTEIELKSAKPKDKPYKLTDGRGLYILVKPNGSKLFRRKYRLDGKEKALALGAYPLTSLKEARGRSEDARRMLKQGMDPANEKKRERLERKVRAANTFEDVAREYITSKAVRFDAEHLKYSIRRLEQNVFGDIGNRPIAEIEAPELLAVLRKIENRGANEMKTRVKGLCGQVFRYGIATGKCKRDPTADLRGALIPHKARRMPSINERELPELLAKIQEYRGEPVTRLGLLLVAHTFLRASELVGAEWTEFDLGAKFWFVPSSRMKMKREHIVPLTPQTIDLIEKLRELNGDKRFVLAMNNPRKPISTNALIGALYRMGYHGRMTVHGFRSVASTVLNLATAEGKDGTEVKRFDRDWIERQMAHAEGDEIRDAYNKAEYLPQRSAMMRWWSNYLDNAIMSSG